MKDYEVKVVIYGRELTLKVGAESIEAARQMALGIIIADTKFLSVSEIHAITLPEEGKAIKKYI